MKVSVQSIHFDADRKLLELIQQKCDKLDHFYDQVIDANVRLRLDKDPIQGNKLAELVLQVPGAQLVASDQGKTFEGAFDNCTEQMRKQLVKHKEKQRP